MPRDHPVRLLGRVQLVKPASSQPQAPDICADPNSPEKTVRCRPADSRTHARPVCIRVKLKQTRIHRTRDIRWCRAVEECGGVVYDVTEELV